MMGLGRHPLQVAAGHMGGGRDMALYPVQMGIHWVLFSTQSRHARNPAGPLRRNGHRPIAYRHPPVKASPRTIGEIPETDMTKDLGPGDKAPAFKLPTDGGGEISSATLKGKPYVLYFYPKDDTSGCTKEAIDFTRSQAQIRRARRRV